MGSGFAMVMTFIDFEGCKRRNSGKLWLVYGHFEVIPGGDVPRGTLDGSGFCFGRGV